MIMKSYLAMLGFALLALANPAASQSSVSIYGIADVAAQTNKSPAGRTTNVVSGGRSGARLGFRGSEDLGDGLNAIFTLEQGINMDVGTVAQGGRGFGRQAFLGLRGNWGTLAAGRVALFSAGTGSFDLFGDVDPMVSSFGIASVGSTFSSASGLRADNSIVYLSPRLAGLQAGLLHSFQLNGNEVSPRSANVHVTAAGVRYDNGPLTAALTYDVFNNPSGGADEKHLQFGVAYDLSVVRLFAAFAKESSLFSNALNISGTTNGAGAKSFMVGATAPMGPSLLRASFQRRNGDRHEGEDRDLRVFSLAYEYNLSKRSMLYAAYSDSRGKGTVSQNPTYDRKVLTTGILHRF